MTSNADYWENEEDEIRITVDAGTFSKPNLYENDPLAGGHDQEDPLEEKGIGGRTRSSSRVNAATPAPATKTVLSCPPPATSSSHNRILSYSSKDAFTAEMDRDIVSIIDESIGLFGLDPRGYHPFYLRIYKYIVIGQQNNYIKSTKDVNYCWEKYDRICAEVMKEPKTTFTGIESPYATFMKTRKVVVNGKEVNLKRNEDEIKKRFVELEKSAKDIVNQWKERESKSILEDLNTRLEFFNKCKSMTFPADCVKMNKLWHRFLYESSDPVKQQVGVKRTDEANDLNLPLVPVPKLSLQTETKSQTWSAVDVEITKLEDEDDCLSQMEFDLDVPPTEVPVPIYMDDKSKPVSQANCSQSAKRGRKHKPDIDEMTEGHLPVIKIKIKNPVSKLSNEKSHFPFSQKSEKPPIKPKRKLKIGVVRGRARQEQKIGFKLSQLKATRALKKLKLKRKGSTLEKQAKLENIICSGVYFSKVKSGFKKKRSLKKDYSPSPSSPAPSILEGQKSPPPPSSPLPTLVAVDHLEKHIVTDHSSLDNSGVENTVSLDRGTPPTPPTNQLRLHKYVVLVPEAPPPPPSLPLPTVLAHAQLNKSAVTDHPSIDKTGTEHAVDLDQATFPTQLTNQKLNKRSVICDICGRVLSKKCYLETHKLRLHSNVKKEPRAKKKRESGTCKKKSERGTCDICGQVITRDCNLMRHKFLKHSSNKNRQKKKCPICLEEFWMLWPHFHQVHIQGVEGLEKGTKNTSTDNNVDAVEPPPSNVDAQKPSGPVSCEICGKYFPYYSTLNRHMEQIHGTNEKSFLCQECPKQFKTKDSLDAHIRQIHLGKDYRCDICSRVMQSGGKLWKHKVDVHGMSELEPPPGVTVMQCEYCGEKLLRGMFQHILKNHPERAEIYEQDRKKYLYLSEEARKRRCERRRAEWRKWRATGKGPQWLQEYDTTRKKRLGMIESWTCPAPNCGKVFEGNFKFEMHLRQGHGSDDNFIAVLEKIQFLKRTPNEIWECVVCEQNLDYVDEVKVHFALQHQQTVKKIEDISRPSTATTAEALYCPHCGEKLDTDQALRDHVETSHPEMCCRCPECEWLVISPTELQEHFMLEHTDPDPFLKLEKRKQKEEENMKNTGKEIKRPIKSAKIKKLVAKSKQKVKQSPTATAPPNKNRRRGRLPKLKRAKSEDSDSESDNFGNSDDDEYFPKMNIVPSGLSSLSTRRNCRNVRSRYKTKYEAPINDLRLKHCQIFVKRLSEAEIAFYCRTSI